MLSSVSASSSAGGDSDLDLYHYNGNPMGGSSEKTYGLAFAVIGEREREKENA